jgi:hypothetical protein
MQFEKSRSGDAIVAHARAVDRRETLVRRPAIPGPYSRSRQQLSRSKIEGLNLDQARLAQPLPNPDTWRRSITAAISVAMAHVMTGLVTYAIAMHPEFLCLPTEEFDDHDRVEDPPRDRHAEDRRRSPASGSM